MDIYVVVRASFMESGYVVVAVFDNLTDAENCGEHLELQDNEYWMVHKRVLKKCNS